MANLSEDIQCVGSDTFTMLDRIDFASWKQRNEGALHLGPERARIYSDLSPDDKDRYNDDIHATNIILQGLPKDIYTLINHYTDAKDIQDNVKMLLEGSELTKEDRHIARNCTQPKRPQNSDYFKDKMLLMQAQENGVVLDEEQLLFLAGGHDTVVDEDVDESPVQDLALNVDNVFQADECDAFDSDVDEAPTAQTMFMANLPSTNLVYDEASLSYDSDILYEVHEYDNYQDAVCEHHDTHEMHHDVQPNCVVDSNADYTSDSNMIMYDQYVKDNAEPDVQSNVSSVPNDAYMMIINEMHKQTAQIVSANEQNKVVNTSLTVELATYKEQVELIDSFQGHTQKVPHHGIDRWLQIQIFYDHVSFHLKCEIDRAFGGKLRNKNADESWEIIENLALYDHEGWDDTKEFVKLVKDITVPQGITKTPDRRLLELEDQYNFLLKGSRPAPPSSSTHNRQAYVNAAYSSSHPKNQNESPTLNSFAFRERTGPAPQPQALGTTFEARVRDYMAAHTERMERFENTIFKQREEINGRMIEMFELLKELTTNKTPEKVLIREETKFPVTKNVNSISLARNEEEENNNTDETPNNTRCYRKQEMAS
ncbi:hypothetical protein Tco_1000231 [Tanacetum coccineum]